MIKKLINNSAFSILNNLIQLIVSLGSGMLVARTLGTDGKGEVFLITQIFNLIAVIFSFGFGPAIIFFLKNNSIEESKINFFILSYSVCLVFFFALSLFFFGDRIGRAFSDNFQIRLLVLTFVIAHLNIISSLVGYKQMSNENGVKRWSIITLISNAFYLICMGIFLLIFNLNVLGVVYALIASGILKTILLLVANINQKVKHGVKRIQNREIRKLATFGFQIFLSNLFLTSVFRLDTFFLNKMVSLSELGLYSVSVNVGELLLLVPSAIGVALFPHLSGLKKEEQTESMCLVGRISFVIGFIGVCGLGAIGYPFIIVVFGQSFGKAFVPFLYLLPGLMAMTLNYAYSNYFSSLGKPLTGAYIFLIGLIVNLGLNLWLIPIFGILGAAISSSIAYIVITIGFIFRIKQISSLSLTEFVFPKISDFMYVKGQLTKFLIKR